MIKVGRSLENMIKRVKYRIIVDALASIHEFSMNSIEMSLEIRTTKSKLKRVILKKCLRMMSIGLKKFKENAMSKKAD
jgi:hypothetical protein